MNMYVVFAVYIISASIILVCLDHQKMRVARNLFLVLTIVLMLYIPIAIWGTDIAHFCTQNKDENLVRATLIFVHKAIDISNIAFASVTTLLLELSILAVTSTIIVVVQTAKVICKFVKKLQNKQQQKPKHPQKRNFQHKLVHSKIQYKRILYLRLCRLNS